MIDKQVFFISRCRGGGAFDQQGQPKLRSGQARDSTLDFPEEAGQRRGRRKKVKKQLEREDTPVRLVASVMAVVTGVWRCDCKQQNDEMGWETHPADPPGMSHGGS